jgi:hypothetical protein
MSLFPACISSSRILSIPDSLYNYEFSAAVLTQGNWAWIVIALLYMFQSHAS